MSEAIVDVDAESSPAKHANLDLMPKSPVQTLERYIAINSFSVGLEAVAVGTSDIALGPSAYSQGTNAIAIGAIAKVEGAAGIAMGVRAAAASNAVAIGGDANVSAPEGIALGRGTTAGTASVAMGSGASCLASWSAVIGHVAKAEANHCVVLGGGALATQYASSALGMQSSCTGSWTVALGGRANAAGEASTALGAGTSAKHVRAVALGANSVTDRDNTVSVGSLSQRRAIRFLADGELGSASHEAITGRQLYATNQKVDAGTAAIAVNKENIATTQSQIKDISGQINQGSIGLVQQDGASRTLTLGVSTDGDLINAKGTKGTRRLSGLSQGQDAADAVNKGQLDTAIGDMKSEVTALTTQMGETSKALSTLDAVAVKYDAASKGKVTFNGDGRGSVLGHVLAGEKDDDAVNKSQLDAVDARVRAFSGALNGLASQVTDLNDHAVKYDAESWDVPIEGNGRITGLGDGVEPGDSVNKGQLDGAIAPLARQLADAVAYSDAAHTLVMLNPGQAAVRVSNLAPGTGERDAVNFSQLSPVLAKARFLMVTGSAEASTSGNDATAVGSGALASTLSTAIGFSASTGVCDVAIGRGAEARSELDGTTFFAGAAIGNRSQSASSGVALGQSTKALGRGTIAIGTAAEAESVYAASVGHQAVTQAESAVALGRRARGVAKDAVALGAYSEADVENTVSVGSSTLKRRLMNVAPGFDDDDAVTVRQFERLRIEHEQLRESAAAQYQQLVQKYDELQARLLMQEELGRRAEALCRQLEVSGVVS